MRSPRSAQRDEARNNRKISSYVSPVVGKETRFFSSFVLFGSFVVDTALQMPNHKVTA